MFSRITPIPMLAVKDVDRARGFYTETLGLQVEQEEMGILQFRAGDMLFMVYPSEYAGTNKATALTWVVGDQLENVIGRLRGKGIIFEHYELPDTVRKGDIHESGPIRNAWFKDPDGNIHALSNLG